MLLELRWICRCVGVLGVGLLSWLERRANPVVGVIFYKPLHRSIHYEHGSNTQDEF